MIHSPRMAELPTTFGKYYLIERLAIGGMAEIFLAKLHGPGGFEKTLVIKQIHPALSSQRAFVDLFVAEAKTLVSLSHGNIVPVYELGVVDDTYFIAMEYIDGPTLWQFTEAALAAGAAIEPGLVAFVTAEIARGLDYAHRKGAGVIHRDLSPRNVMLTRDGEVKLVDFGIAIALGAGPDPADGGLPTGSLPYMAPEQARGEALTAQSDLFALGVLAWEMVTGRRLFSRASADETVAAVAAAAVPAPVTVRPEVPARLDAIIMRALAREPADRWPNAGELAAALQRYQAEADAMVGARELATLVARLTPPIVHVAAERSGPTTAIDLASTAGDEAGAPPATPVVPRAQPRGKRAATAREATFATHVELERALGPRTAPHPRPTPPTTVAVPRPSAPTMAAVEPAPEPTPPSGSTAVLAEPTAMAAPEPTAPASRRRARGLFAGATALALFAVAALLAWPRGERATTVAIDAAPPPAIDAAAPPPDAAPPPPIDAAPAPLPPIDAGPPSPPRDAPPRDAGRAATGVLRVGANPWGEVFLDGRRLGRAPNEWTVPAGAHAVDVVFPGDDGESRRRFSVEVPAGDRAVVFADFAAP